MLALRPAGRQRLVAIIAKDESAQRKVRIDIFAGRSLRRGLESRLYLLECLEADKALVLALAQAYAPIRRFDVSGIDRARQQIVDALIADFSVRQIFRERRLALQETLDLNLCCKAPRSVAFERFLQDRGIGLIAHQQFSVTAFAFVAIADRCLKNPITILNPCPHAVHGLLAILLALMLRYRRQKVFDELGIGILAKLD
ncbi:hypothetical protein MUB46_02915 [Microbaculum sp. A6E488]|uniref:Uncharacterized protein n=1 Tax=Microbaculum marinisediminis TaxID=2931392 RepID=A0AAW5QT14_9HYPH|nr:hypothetical protein [Microbaculum sp. A6E488]MCT8970803.1 hypothetical protein [Microbaculum sp. A6E488]